MSISSDKKTLFYKRLKNVINQSGKSANQIERELGYSRNALHNYKNGTEPSGIRLVELADYFNVSPEYLIGLTNCPARSKVDEWFKEMNDPQRLEMLILCQNWAVNAIKTAQLSKMIINLDESLY